LPPLTLLVFASPLTHCCCQEWKDDGTGAKYKDESGKLVATKAGDQICDNCHQKLDKHTKISAKDASGKSVDKFQCVSFYFSY
jgi:hypothetical protein